jgi:hypothetical protein
MAEIEIIDKNRAVLRSGPEQLDLSGGLARLIIHMYRHYQASSQAEANIYLQGIVAGSQHMQLTLDGGGDAGDAAATSAPPASRSSSTQHRVDDA